MHLIWILGCVSLLHLALPESLARVLLNNVTCNTWRNCQGRFIYSGSTYKRVPLQNVARKKPARATHN